MNYRAPVERTLFALHEIVGFGRLYGSLAFPELTRDLTATVIGEAGRFADGVLAPLNRVGDTTGARFDNGKVTLPPGFVNAYKAFVEAGWNGVSCPTQYGGQGLPHTVGVAVQEYWQASNMAFGLCPLLTCGAIEALSTHGTREQKAVYLPKLVTGEWTGTMNLTEPQAGSDVGALKTRATRADDGTYRITGSKIFITWGEHESSSNIVHLVLARLPEAPIGTRGITLFLVPKFLVGADGRLGARNDLRCTGIEHKLGIHGSPTCSMSYGDEGGAVGFLIGAENKGMVAMFTMMNAARLNVGVQGVAIAERAFQQALAFAGERRQGKPYGLSHDMAEMAPIIQHPDVRRMLLTMKSQIEAGRALCLATAMATDEARHGEDAQAREAAKGREELLTPLAKAWCTEMGVEVASLGVQIHGGMGYIEEAGAAQHYRDARIAPIYEGTNGIQAIDLVGRKLGLQAGGAIKALLHEIEEGVAVCANTRTGIARLAESIGQAHRAVSMATECMQTTMRDDAAKGLAGATPYLKALSMLASAHLLAKGAIAAARKVEEGAGPREFYTARIQSAEFFAENILPMAKGLSYAAINGAPVIVGASTEEIES
jgi:alkylation response protein AidB-like acyl-CoA dehydrogenase